MGQAALALAPEAVEMAVVFTGCLGPVPDGETEIVGELVRGLKNHLHDELVGNGMLFGLGRVAPRIRDEQTKNSMPLPALVSR